MIEWRAISKRDDGGGGGVHNIRLFMAKIITLLNSDVYSYICKIGAIKFVLHCLTVRFYAMHFQQI